VAEDHFNGGYKMDKKSFLQAVVGPQIHEAGKRLDWWPLRTKQAFLEWLEKDGVNLRGNGDHVLVGLNRNGGLTVREISSVADASGVTEEAFVMSYRQLTKEVYNDDSI